MRSTLPAGRTLFATVLLVASSACNLLEGGTEQVAILLETNFLDDHVRVEVDGRVVYEDTTTTNHIIGLAERVEIDMEPGFHLVRVQVNDAASGARVVSFKRERYMTVTYDPGEKVVHLQAHEKSPVYF